MICFRPLLGVPISQYGKIIMLYCKAKGFRPLLGVPISQYGEDAFNKTIQFAVSVPSSGFLYLNLLGERSNGKSYATVSVPSSGFLYLNNYRNKHFDKANKLFPSPPRGSYISILSSISLKITGMQSRIAAQNQIRLIPSYFFYINTPVAQYFQLSA